MDSRYSWSDVLLGRFLAETCMCFLVGGLMEMTIYNATTFCPRALHRINGRSRGHLVTNGVVIGSLELESVLRKPACCSRTMARGYG